MLKDIVRGSFLRVHKALRGKTTKTQAPEDVGPTGKFIPDLDSWIYSHFVEVPDSTVHFCGSNIFEGARVINIGCGEMLTDFGILRYNPTSITGLDISEQPDGHLESVAGKLVGHGIDVVSDYKEKLNLISYDGRNFPLDDNSYDVVFSWSAFEHVTDVDQVLSEIHRIMKDDGKAFIQVYPWHPSLFGSHLSDWIEEPYFHLRRDDEWVLSELRKKADIEADKKDFILGHMWPEYQSLNRLSPRSFYKSVLKAGFKVVKARLITHDHDLSMAPPEADFADLMISGTMMLLSKR